MCALLGMSSVRWEEAFEKDGINGRKATITLTYRPERNARYHFVVTVTIASRAAIRGGASSEEVYTWSDRFIRQMDSADDFRFGGGAGRDDEDLLRPGPLGSSPPNMIPNAENP